MVILGIDPGLNATGYGFTESNGSTLRFIAAGAITPPKKQALALRLHFLHEKLSALITQYHPQTMVIETIFTHKRYVNTASLMAHARGVACLVAQQHGLICAEYSPARVKKAITGNGNASKTQVARMISQWIGEFDSGLSADATDALALAIGHAHMNGSLIAGNIKI